MKWLGLSALVIILDQVTKALATSYLSFHESLPIFAGLNFTLRHNPGAAFSFLSDAGGWQRWLFTGLAAVVSLVLIAWLRQVPRERWWLAIALALILGGAIGNLWDRLILGYVIDFIVVYYGSWEWPAFNIADSAICIGAVMLLADSFLGHSGEVVK